MGQGKCACHFIQLEKLQTKETLCHPSLFFPSGVTGVGGRMPSLGDGIIDDHIFWQPLLSVSPASRALAWPPRACEALQPPPPWCVFLQSSTRAAVLDGWGGSLLRERGGKGAALLVTVFLSQCVKNRMRGPYPLYTFPSPSNRVFSPNLSLTEEKGAPRLSCVSPPGRRPLSSPKLR